MGQHLQANLDFLHVEASDYMHYLFDAESEHDETISQFALRKMASDPIAIPRFILGLTGSRWGSENNVVISGFRSPIEVQEMAESLRTIRWTRTIYVQAAREVRFRRCAMRKRSRKDAEWSTFAIEDGRQCNMGVQDVRDQAGVITVHNEGTIQEYLRTVEGILQDLDQRRVG